MNEKQHGIVGGFTFNLNPLGNTCDSYEHGRYRLTVGGSVFPIVEID